MSFLLFYERALIVAAAFTTTFTAAFVAILTISARGCVKGGCVAATAAFAAVINSTAAFVRNARVRTSKFGRPVFGRVAGGAICSKQSGVISRVAVTGHTRAGCAGILSIIVAALTGQAGVAVGQCETAVAKLCIIPIGWVMTDCAIGPIVAFVFIVFLMAGITIGGRTLENTIDMAGFAPDLRMTAF